jgi:hypothetical protein
MRGCYTTGSHGLSEVSTPGVVVVLHVRGSESIAPNHIIRHIHFAVVVVIAGKQRGGNGQEKYVVL